MPLTFLYENRWDDRTFYGIIEGGGCHPPPFGSWFWNGPQDLLHEYLAAREGLLSEQTAVGPFERETGYRNLSPSKRPFLVQKIKWALGKKKSEIDWNKTQAYFINTGHSYGIKINLMGREPEGIVQPEEYQEVRHRIIEELNLTVDEPEGRRVFERVFRREDIYWGPYTKEAPDIIFIPDCEYTLNDRMKDDIFKKNKEGRSFHRRDGILILQGPGIKRGKK